ncbi:MAG: ATP-binding protein [Selenomonadaceae bacterium]|nr:ATP-binding protein [Selenomonadaceae bacterium]
MLKNVAFPAKRELLPEMLKKITDEIDKYVKDSKWLNRLKVCSEEILINIIDYSGSDKVYITCEFLDAEKTLRFEFADEGTPYNPLEEKSEVDIDADIDERSIGGLGIFLYTTMMDKMEYRYANGKNHLIAIKKFSGKEAMAVAE